MKPNPWIDRFDGLTKEKIRDRFTSQPIPIDPDKCESPAELKAKLKQAIISIAIPTEHSAAVCERLVDRSVEHARSLYGDKHEFIRRCYAREGPTMPTENFPVTLTGPAGIGKSTLVNRLAAILPEQTTIPIDEGNKSFPLISLWYVNIRDLQTITAILRKLIVDAGGKPTGKNVDELVKQCRRLAYQAGICMLIVDELQFLTKSINATARIIGLIYDLTRIGVPVTLVANYSLVSRLKKRPQQDKQRILGTVEVLSQASAHSADWERVVSGFICIAPKVLKVDIDKHKVELHTLTAGTPRLLAYLIQSALDQAKGRSPIIKIEELRTAYGSTSFSASREDVELINQQFATGRPAREDLWCPVTIPSEKEGELAKTAEAERLARMADSMLRNSLTLDQLALLKDLEESHQEPNVEEKVVPIGSKAKPATKDFEAGASILEKLRKRK